jgi:hypothetical protein
MTDCAITQLSNYPITRLPDVPILLIVPCPVMSDQPFEPALSFTAFVLSLASTAAIHFGDLPDPQSGEHADPHLEGAAQMIEILALLEQKTRGNLTLEERQVLEQVLYELRLRFVEATARGKRIIEP